MWENFNIKTCIYCGDTWRIERHHYKESVANSGKKRTFRKGNTLPTCRECNALLGAVNPSYIDCCYILYEKVSTRHKNLLSMPSWTKEELHEISKNLRRKTKLAIFKKNIHMNRLEQLLKNAQSPLTYQHIKDIVLYGICIL